MRVNSAARKYLRLQYIFFLHFVWYVTDVFYFQLDQLVFIEPPNKKLYCALCNHVSKDPVIVSCGVSDNRFTLNI